MAKVSPYHTSSDEESAHNREVYHDHDDCEDGRRIKPWNKVAGTALRPKCKVCSALG